MARPRRQTRRAPADEIPWGWILAGTAVVGGVGLLAWGAANPAAGSAPLFGPAPTSDPTTGLATGFPPGTIVTVPITVRDSAATGSPSSESFSYDANGRGIVPASTQSRLNGSDQARQVYALEALIYSFGVSDQLPDALLSTVNGELSQISPLAPPGAVDPTFSSASLAQMRNYLATQGSGSSRQLALAMPQALISAINASAYSADPGFPALPQIAAAGQVLNPAG